MTWQTPSSTGTTRRVREVIRVGILRVSKDDDATYSIILATDFLRYFYLLCFVLSHFYFISSFLRAFLSITFSYTLFYFLQTFLFLFYFIIFLPISFYCIHYLFVKQRKKIYTIEWIIKWFREFRSGFLFSPCVCVYCFSVKINTGQKPSIDWLGLNHHK